jgi:hypothetical protein
VGMAERRLCSPSGGQHRPRRVREMVCELRESKANEMRARRKEKGERRVGVHGAVFSGELDRNSGEQLPRIEALARRAKASTGCAKGRRCSDEDGGSGDELWWPERPTTASARTIAVAEAGARALLRLARGGSGGGVSECGWVSRGAGKGERGPRGPPDARCRRRRRMAATGRAAPVVDGYGARRRGRPSAGVVSHPVLRTKPDIHYM